MVAALAVLPVAIVEQIFFGGWADMSTEVLNWLIWAAFMLAGIGVVSFITANIAAFFVESDQELDPANRLRILEQCQERLGISLEQIRPLFGPRLLGEPDPLPTPLKCGALPV